MRMIRSGARRCCWIAAEFINPAKHPFYRHGAAVALLAFRNGRPVGRILVSDDPHFNEHSGANAGCFGMFESEDDPEVAHALLDAAAAWLVERGRTQILGPIDYSTNYACGLLVDGFDTPPRLMMNHNPAYYQPLLESWGLTKEKDLFAWWFDHYELINAWRPRVERLAARHGVTVRHVRRSELAADLGDLLAVYNEAWKDNWGHVPMTEAEFKYMAGQLLHIAVPELLLVAEVNGQPVGCSMTLPDFNEATGPLDGKLFRFGLPLGVWKLWRGLKRIKSARLLALGVLKEFRRRGIAELLILRTFDYGHNVQGYNAAELGWTLEDNVLINQTISTGQADTDTRPIGFSDAAHCGEWDLALMVAIRCEIQARSLVNSSECAFARKAR